VGKYCKALQSTDDNVIRRMRCACWIPKATNTYSECVLLLFHGNSGYANAPPCYVILILPVLFRDQEGSGFDYRQAGRRLLCIYRDFTQAVS